MIQASLKRPVAVTMIYTAIALLGAFAWRNIPLELLPDTSFPRLTVSASWSGASPETVEAFLTAPLEAAIDRVRGVERIESTSQEGFSRIAVEFDRDTDMDFARIDLSERLASLEETLPDGTSRPTVQVYVPQEFESQQTTFLTYTFWGPYTLEALREHIDEVIAPELRRIEGVAEVYAYGGRRRNLEISLDPDAVAALGLNQVAVRRAILELDLVREAGAVRESGDQRTITIVNRPETADEIANAVVASPGGTIVRVADVARVYDGYEERTSHNRINRQPASTFQVLREPGVNAVRVAEEVKARLAELAVLNPYGTRLELGEDESRSINDQMSELRDRALLGAVAIFFGLFLFLRSLRSPALIFATIAFSVLVALNLIYFGGLTLNVLTLMGLAMGFGLIVDNSIVVMENIFRRWQRGESHREAGVNGAKEVALAIFASTLTTLIVFIPFVYMQGELRILYVPLAIVVGLTLAASIFVAFTFIPSLTTRMLRRSDRALARANARVPFYLRFYRDLVGFAVRRPWAAIGFTVLVFAGSYYLFDQNVTRGRIFNFGGYGNQTYIDIRVELPRGANLERTDMLVKYFEDRLAEMPEVKQFTSRVGQTNGSIRVTFPEELENTHVPVVIKEQLTGLSYTFTGAEVRVYGYGPSFYGGGGGAPQYGMTVTGYNYERVRDIAEALGDRLRRISRIRDVDTNSSGGWFTRDKASEYAVWIDRDRVGQLGFTVNEIVSQLRTAIRGGESSASRIKLGGDEVQYSIKLEGASMIDVVGLREALLETADGRRVRAGDVVHIEQRDVLATIRRVNQQYERRVAYEFRGPPKLGNRVHESVIESTELPVGYEVSDDRRGFRISADEQRQVNLVIAIAFVLVFMVTAALFESFLQPLCVMLTVPMALIGVFLIFFLTGEGFTREAYVGVIMMFGIVVNNAILLVDHINRVRAREPHLGLHEAIIAGTSERVRPILMTTTTTVLGLIPLVVFGGAGTSNIWDALALVLIGGLLSSTLFVLTATPALYGLFERLRERMVGGERPPSATGTALPASAAEA